jgi:hypothetical protein
VAVALVVWIGCNGQQLGLVQHNARHAKPMWAGGENNGTVRQKRLKFGHAPWPGHGETARMQRGQGLRRHPE